MDENYTGVNCKKEILLEFFYVKQRLNCLQFIQKLNCTILFKD